MGVIAAICLSTLSSIVETNVLVQGAVLVATIIAVAKLSIKWGVQIKAQSNG
jgi:hypothetical protein